MRAVGGRVASVSKENPILPSEWGAAFGAAIDAQLGKRPHKWLAQGIGVSESTVSRFINGKQTPTLDQLARIALRLGVSRRSLLQSAGYLDGEGLIDPHALPAKARDLVLALVGPGGFGHGLNGKPNDLESDS